MYWSTLYSTFYSHPQLFRRRLSVANAQHQCVNTAITSNNASVYTIVESDVRLNILRYGPAELGEMETGADTAVWQPQPHDHRGTPGQPLPPSAGEGEDQVLQGGTLGDCQVCVCVCVWECVYVCVCVCVCVL